MPTHRKCLQKKKKKNLEKDAERFALHSPYAEEGTSKTVMVRDLELAKTALYAGDMVVRRMWRKGLDN